MRRVASSQEMTGLTQNFLNEQSDRIERVLREYRIPARVEGGQVTPRWVRYHVRSAAGTQAPWLQQLSRPLAAALGSSHVRLAQEGGRLAINVPRPDAEPISLVAILRREKCIPPLTACLGLEEDGTELCLRLTSPAAAHVLVVGEAGAGKTELLKTLVLSLALTHRQAQFQVAVVDMNRHGLEPLRHLPHALNTPAASEVEVRMLLDSLGRELDRRLQAGVSEPRILLIVDGLDELAARVGPTAVPLLDALLRDGFAAGCHLAAATRRPVPALPPEAFPVLIAGRLRDASEAASITGLTDSGAEQLLGAGDFLAVVGGQAIPFQAAWVPQEDWDEMYLASR